MGFLRDLAKKLLKKHAKDLLEELKEEAAAEVIKRAGPVIFARGGAGGTPHSPMGKPGEIVIVAAGSPGSAGTVGRSVASKYKAGCYCEACMTQQEFHARMRIMSDPEAGAEVDSAPAPRILEPKGDPKK